MYMFLQKIIAYHYEVSRNASGNYVANSIGEFTPRGSLGLKDDYPSQQSGCPKDRSDGGENHVSLNLLLFFIRWCYKSLF